MNFKGRRIPRHLIIEDEYEVRRRPRFGFFRILLLMVVVVSITWLVSTGVVQI